MERLCKGLYKGARPLPIPLPGCPAPALRHSNIFRSACSTSSCARRPFLSSFRRGHASSISRAIASSLG
jgi:hypothetical protein